MNVHLCKEIKCNFQSNASDCLLQMSKFKADIHGSPEKYFRSMVTLVSNKPFVCWLFSECQLASLCLQYPSHLYVKALTSMVFFQRKRPFYQRK